MKLVAGQHLTMSSMLTSSMYGLEPYIPLSYIYIASTESDIIGHDQRVHQRHG